MQLFVAPSHEGRINRLCRVDILPERTYYGSMLGPFLFSKASLPFPREKGTVWTDSFRSKLRCLCHQALRWRKTNDLVPSTSLYFPNSLASQYWPSHFLGREYCQCGKQGWTRSLVSHNWWREREIEDKARELKVDGGPITWGLSWTLAYTLSDGFRQMSDTDQHLNRDTLNTGLRIDWERGGGESGVDGSNLPSKEKQLFWPLT